jgi:group I intron endonuclease
MVIYKIINTVNSKVYVGQTIVPVKNRFMDHIRMLRDNVHFNYKLQSDFNILGKNAFGVEILEEIGDKHMLDTAEIYYISKLQSIEYGYNLSEGGQKGSVYSKTWNGFIDPLGYTLEPIKNLSQFCRDNNLSAKSMRQVFHGDKYSHKGYHHIDRPMKQGFVWPIGHKQTIEHRQKITEGVNEYWKLCGGIHSRGKKISIKLKEYYCTNTHHRSKTYQGVVSPNGIVYESVKNLEKFCRDNTLDRNGFRRWICSNKIEYKGWTKLINPHRRNAYV